MCLGVGLAAVGQVTWFGAYIGLVELALFAAAFRQHDGPAARSARSTLAAAGFIFALYVTLIGFVSYLLAAVPVLLLWLAANLIVVRQGSTVRSWLVGAGLGAMAGALPGFVLIFS